MGFYDVQDTISPQCGQVYFDINGKVKEQTGVQKITTKTTINERSYKTIGTNVEQTKVTSLKFSGSMTVNYQMVKTFDEMIAEFEKTKIFPTFDITVINYDDSTPHGRRVVKYNKCILTGDVETSKLDGTSDEALTTDVNFRYASRDILEDYND